MARHGRGFTPDAAGRGRCRPGGRRGCSSAGPCSTAAPPERTAPRLSERPRWSSRRASSSPGRSGRCRSAASRPGGARGGVAAAGLVAWSGLTIWWSIAGDRSWDALAKGIVVLAFGVVGLAASALPGRPLRTLALILAGALGAVLVWALDREGDSRARAGRCGPRRAAEGVDRLLERARAPRGCGARPRPLARRLGRGRFGRPAGALLLFGATLVILLTQSRAGVARRGRGRRARPRALREPCRGGSALPALRPPRRGRRRGWAFTRPALVEDGGARADRVADGRVARRSSSSPAPRPSSCSCPSSRSRGSSRRRRRDVVRGLVGATALVAVVGLLGLVLSVGNPVSWATDQLGGSGEVVERPGPARESRDEQPHGVVGGGLAGVPRPSGRGDGRADLRDRAQAVPRRRPERERAAQRPAAAALRRGPAGPRPRPGARRGPRGRPPRERPAARAGRARGRGRACSRSRSRSASTRWSTTTSTSSPSPRRPASSRRRCSGRGGPPPRSVAVAFLRSRPSRRPSSAIWLLVAPALSTRADRPGLPAGRRGGSRGGRGLGTPRPAPEPALTRAALRARHRRVARGSQPCGRAALRAGDASSSPRTRIRGTSSASSASSRSATSAPRTPRSTRRTRSIREQPVRARGRAGRGAGGRERPEASGLRAVVRRRQRRRSRRRRRGRRWRRGAATPGGRRAGRRCGCRGRARGAGPRPRSPGGT